MRPLGGHAQAVALHAVEAPGALARPHAQARLLRVDREHGELGLGQSAWKQDITNYNQ